MSPRLGLLLVTLGSVGALYAGCSAAEDPAGTTTQGSGNSGNGSGEGGSGGSLGGAGAGASSGGVGGELLLGGGGTGGIQGCVTFTEEAEMAPAAMLVALDMSASMAGTKWNAARQAVVTALDKDVFDNMSLGLVTFPSSYQPPPQCLCTAIGLPDLAQCAQLWPILTGAPGVSCGVSAQPQVSVVSAGTLKSADATGVRKQILDYLSASTPISTADDGSPIYEAMLAGYNALSLVPDVDKRVLVLVTDGGFSCTSLSNPQRPAFTDANGCQDWEHPDEVNDLIAEWRTSATTPTNTFVVGVPGSNSSGAPVGGFDTPPYAMLLALSTYAVSGSPLTVDPSCSSAATFVQGAPPPPSPCHIDMSNGLTFSATALADALAAIRGAALGCVYPLPEPPLGETIDPGQVNVEVTADGTTVQVPKRSDPSDTCDPVGCWDYTAALEVELLGATCDLVSTAQTAKVEIVVGCETIAK